LFVALVFPPQVSFFVHDPAYLALQFVPTRKYFRVKVAG